MAEQAKRGKMNSGLVSEAYGSNNGQYQMKE